MVRFEATFGLVMGRFGPVGRICDHPIVAGRNLVSSVVTGSHIFALKDCRDLGDSSCLESDTYAGGMLATGKSDLEADSDSCSCSRIRFW